LMTAACDKHPEACWEMYRRASQAEKESAEEQGVLRSSIGKFEYLFLSFAADGGHVLAMNTLAHLLVTAKDAAFVRDTL
jgi:hypothetical protein